MCRLWLLVIEGGCLVTYFSPSVITRKYTHAQTEPTHMHFNVWRDVRVRGQLGVRCLAHGHLGSAQQVNWYLLNLNQRPSGSQAKSPQTVLLPPSL